MLPLTGLIAGIVIGLFIPWNIPQQFSCYAAVAIMAALDSAFTGIKDNTQNKFSPGIFIFIFTGNLLIAGALVYLGDRLGLQLYLAAVFAFGYRIFTEFAIIAGFLLNKKRKKDNI